MPVLGQPVLAGSRRFGRVFLTTPAGRTRLGSPGRGEFDRARRAALSALCERKGSRWTGARVVELARFESSVADFSDCLVLEAARDAGALPVLTFDERFAREPDVQLVASAESRGP